MKKPRYRIKVVDEGWDCADPNWYYVQRLFFGRLWITISGRSSLHDAKYLMAGYTRSKKPIRFIYPEPQ